MQLLKQVASLMQRPRQMDCFSVLLMVSLSNLWFLFQSNPPVLVGVPSGFVFFFKTSKAYPQKTRNPSLSQVPKSRTPFSLAPRGSKRLSMDGFLDDKRGLRCLEGTCPWLEGTGCFPFLQENRNHPARKNGFAPIKRAEEAMSQGPRKPQMGFPPSWHGNW